MALQPTSAIQLQLWQGISPEGGKMICPPAMAVQQWNIVSPPIRPLWIQKLWRIYDRLQTVPQSTHLWWLAVAKLQAASVPIAYAGSCTMGQTDGWIVVSLNATPTAGGMIITTATIEQCTNDVQMHARC